MHLTKVTEIRSAIARLTSAKILWLDTEVADWQTSRPRLSLIQVLSDPQDTTGESAYLLDVLDRLELVAEFINQIMVNPKIEKVFHNASFDLRFLGKKKVENVTCTLKLARKISCDRLQVPNLKLKTLAIHLCHFANIDEDSGKSDWAKRPLSEKQLHYAKMDVVYLAHVHHYLLAITQPQRKPISTMGNSQSCPLSVTKVRVALECPRLFYLAHHFGGKTLFQPSECLSGTGTLFHQLANELIAFAKQEPQFSALFNPSAERLQVEAVASQMQQLFYKFKFYPHLQNAIQANPNQAPLYQQIWQALSQLIQRWSELLVKNRHYYKTKELIKKTFIAQEYKIRHSFKLPNGEQQEVTGQFDSLIFNREQNRLCVVEYKTYEPVDPSAQLAQVALYSYILYQKTKLPVDAVIYCVLPEFKPYHYSFQELEETIHRLIPHKLQQMQNWLAWQPPQPDPPPPTTTDHLCRICPQQQKCQTYFINPNPSVKNSPQPAYPTLDADKIGQQLVEILQSFKVGVDYLGAAVGPAFIRIKLKPHLGIKVNALLKLSEDLKVQLGIASVPLIASQSGYVSVDLPREDRQVARFEDYINPQTSSPNAPVSLAIGVDLEDKLVEADLSDPNTCHFLVGGTTGSGKSEFLRSLLLSLTSRHTPQQLKIALVDPKRVTFPEFESMPWLLSPVVKESDRAIELMETLVEQMHQRYQQFEAAKCPNLETYNQQLIQQQKPSLARIVCIFDEYADLMVEKETRSALELSIKRLGAMARAAGIHLIIATQRPEASVVTPIIRSNLPGRVALRTASEADSAIILGGKQSEAAYLLGKGDLLYLVGAKLQRLQSLFAQNVTEILTN